MERGQRGRPMQTKKAAMSLIEADEEGGGIVD